MDELAKNERLGDLYAYYEKLLTKRQQDYFKDYYYNDLSLGEIAENHCVSRQAVYDNLKRSSAALEKYEAKLQMKAEYQLISKKLANISSLLSDNDNKKAQEEINSLLNKLGD